MKKAFGIGWLLLGLFLVLPVMNMIFEPWIEAGGVFDSFNTTNYGNATSNSVSVELTNTEWAIWRLFVPFMALVIVGCIIYILGNWSRNKSGGQDAG